jgi:hypothetical protein
MHQSQRSQLNPTETGATVDEEPRVLPVSVRLHNTSQLAGFAKAEDLAYFLRKIGGIEYVNQPLLAPTDPMLKAYKKEKGDWSAYEGSLPRADVGTPHRESLQPGNVRWRMSPLLGSDDQRGTTIGSASCRSPRHLDRRFNRSSVERMA